VRNASWCARIEARADVIELKGEAKTAGVHTEYTHCLRHQNMPRGVRLFVALG
jgi:hypothetical protein